ncbi:hypothetical protein JCM8547_000756 [Rhodosporidiobolus lusitaniae]
MASAVASTSSYVFPPLSIAPSLLVRSPSSPQDTKPRLPTALVLDKDDPAVPKEKSGGRAKRYLCTWPGCGKAYTRPVRLEEHQRVHTGERPFACSQCSSTFARDSHLKAHMRTHSSEAEKTYICTEGDGCDKKFWTNQHLKKHIEVVHRGKTYDCPDCDETFRKHHQLRTHIAEVHATPGTKPFPCEHPGCGKSFMQKVHLKAHEKTHDPSRYVCLHPACLTLPLISRQFGTWTLLQRHTKTAHPPTCPYPHCNGKRFTTNRGLRNHLAAHEADEREANGDGGGTTTEAEREEEGDKTVRIRKRGRGRKRRGAAERMGKMVKKEESEGEADGEENRGEQHEEDDKEDTDGAWEEREDEARDERMREDFRYGGKKKRKVLAEAVGFPPIPTGPLPVWPLPSLPDPTLSSSDEHSGPSSQPLPSFSSTFRAAAGAFTPIASTSTSSSFYGAALPAPAKPTPSSSKRPQREFLDLLTGSNYSQPAASSSSTSMAHSGSGGGGGLANVPRKYPCPFPAIFALPFTDLGPCAASSPPPHVKHEHDAEEDEDEDEDVEGTCKFWFKRVYDVERHLRARHGVEMEGGRKTLEGWYEADE